MNDFVAEVDFETRSACNLQDCGAWKYSLDLSTEVMCLVYRLPYWPDGQTALWTPAYPKLGIAENFDSETLLELLDWIDQGELLEAHNSFFELAIWTNVLAPVHGFPLPALSQFRCSAAKAAAHAIPRKLEDAGLAMRLKTLKDIEGHKVMMKLSKPRKPRKKERETWAASHGTAPHPRVYFEDYPLFEKLWSYCRQDVLAEGALSHSLDDLNPAETQNFILDQTINQRGFRLDLEAVDIALSLIQTENALLNSELAELTNGAVTRATQRERMKKWLATEGLTLYDTKGATIDDILLQAETGEASEDPFAASIVGSLPPAARRALEILRTLGRSSTAKYETMLDWACPDGRVRGGLLFHGASTGRWSGKGVQPHNFIKGSIKSFDMEEAWTLIKSGNREAILAKYPSIMETLACALRGAIVAPKGKQLYIADYAGIEARVLLWAAGDKKGVDIFHRGADIYCDMATGIYDRPITKKDKTERGMGKIAILGLGYQMGWSKFQATCATFGITIDDEFAGKVVDTYRAKYHRVKQLWYDTEDAAVAATAVPGRIVKNGYCSWQRIIDKDRGTDFLFCTLPSGRRLAYCEPELRERQTPWGSTKMALTFMGLDAYTKKWKRQTTYGGNLVENEVQAISRDILASALQRLELSGIYVPVLHVHDEIISEARLGTGSVSEYEGMLTTLPAWANGCPIAAEGFVAIRFRK